MNTQKVVSTDLKDQKMTGKCWSFASTSYLETEAIRLGNDVPEISSFYFVYHNYLYFSRQYIRNNGDMYNKFGDLTFSVLSILDSNGAVPRSVYDGKLRDVQTPKEKERRMSEENEMNSKILSGLDSLIEAKQSVEVSMEYVKTILDDYIGTPPNRFVYEGKEYTPTEFADNILKLEAANYIEVTSYSHLAFNEFVLLDIPANWRNKEYFNLQIDSLISLIDNGLKNGYSFAWDGDIGYRDGFLDRGLGIVKGEYEDVNIIDQHTRQKAFEDGTTTDDHNMHIIGTTYDKKGSKFYVLKNSWGDDRGINGFWYLSENYLRLRTISITSHVDLIKLES